ncbi:hypothetical protein [Amycolatopsis sp. WQ 127309]|uniref:hypothetical protein n=1 Tax=Amycolatopsis sp. WQ 127309 TaxID=2932773 RepID=UPI001FF1A8ED|nr:hypothetical protein [Amycolatopsis sp. WQ 127309]UOZ11338.1 hypothetical protein MUY22_24950 [Amycolatopsis sp. WQ 127309]
MTSPPDHGRDPRGRQFNHTEGGTNYISQGEQTIHNGDYLDRSDRRNTYHQISRARSYAGRWVLAIALIDIVYFAYGAAAYSGNADDHGDLVRAVIFFVLLAITGSLIRRWFRAG